MDILEKQKFIQAVKNNISIAAVLRELDRAAVGSNYRYVKTNISILNLDISHWKGQSHGASTPRSYSNDQMFKINSNISTQIIKKRILKDNLIEYKCSNCKILPIWDNKPLVFRLDHINGVRNDNRLENLRFLCPNCDSQTSTFCGKNKKNQQKPDIKHKKKSHYIHAKKIVWPSLEELLEELKDTSYVALGIKLGVSDNAIRKHIKYELKRRKEQTIKIDPLIFI